MSQPNHAEKVLHAITAKREAAAAKTVAAEKDQADFKEKFTHLIGTFETLHAANIATQDGKFIWWFRQEYDNQNRLEKFCGLGFRFGGTRPERTEKLWVGDNGGSILEPYGNKGEYRLAGKVVNGYFDKEFFAAQEKLGTRKCASDMSANYYHLIPIGQEEAIIEHIINWLARVADR